jgi:DNA processing protein
MQEDLIYQIALTQVPQIGPIHARILFQHFGSAERIFKSPGHKLEKIEGIGQLRAGKICSFNEFKRCEQELTFTQKNNIKIIPFYHEDYPKRLLQCHDAPLLIYYKGDANLNAGKMISVVGTRNLSEYGKKCCEDLIASFYGTEITIVSGLAMGIDTIAHKAALKNSLKTVGILGHGMDRIYPGSNAMLSRQMIENGGLITEFISGTKPDKNNFPARNRITAGISDAVVVVESGIKGGSLITAELANDYHKDVFVFPGSVFETSHAGCHMLIKQHKASLITEGKDVLEMMNWQSETQQKKPIQSALFPTLKDDEAMIFNYIREKKSAHIDELYLFSGLKNSVLSGLLLQLELSGLIKAGPGNRYTLPH